MVNEKDAAVSAADVGVSEVPVGTEGVRVDVVERTSRFVSGWLGLLGALALIGIGIWFVILSQPYEDGIRRPVWFVVAMVVFLLSFFVFGALTVISPGQSRVVQFFGTYMGTVRRTGLVMTPLLATRKNVSVRVRNFETSELKVNDADGNPIIISAIIVWQVADTAKAVFAVDDYTDFVTVQAEAALRHVATGHPYDDADPGEVSLRGSTEQVSTELAHEVAERVALAGVEVVEARISQLSYAPEIAQAMLQRQQAGAIIAAREQIVEGAVTMVESALSRLEEENVVTLDDERRAAMVSNLLVVLCGDSRATPVVNTGTLYA